MYFFFGNFKGLNCKRKTKDRRTEPLLFEGFYFTTWIRKKALNKARKNAPDNGPISIYSRTSISGHLLSGQPPLSGHFLKSQIISVSLNCSIRYLYETANLCEAASLQSSEQSEGGRLIEVRMYQYSASKNRLQHEARVCGVVPRSLDLSHGDVYVVSM